MYNARRMSQFFPTEHRNDFLSEWYDWESDEQPVVLDAVLPEAAEDEILEVPIPNGLDVPLPQAIAEPPAVVRRLTHPSKPPDPYGICKKK